MSYTATLIIPAKYAELINAADANEYYANHNGTYSFVYQNCKYTNIDYFLTKEELLALTEAKVPYDVRTSGYDVDGNDVHSVRYDENGDARTYTVDIENSVVDVSALEEALDNGTLEALVKQRIEANHIPPLVA
jgi:opacity protein-like surface antigen